MNRPERGAPAFAIQLAKVAVQPRTLEMQVQTRVGTTPVYTGPADRSWHACSTPPRVCANNAGWMTAGGHNRSPAPEPADPSSLIDAELQRLLEQAGLQQEGAASDSVAAPTNLASDLDAPAPTLDLGDAGPAAVELEAYLDDPEIASLPPAPVERAQALLDPAEEADEAPPVPTIDLKLPQSDGAADETYDPGAERRGGRRHRLKGNALPVILAPREGEPSRGRVRDISVTGGLFIESRLELAHGTPLMLSFSLASGQALSLEGKVARVTPEGFGVHLVTDETARGFLNILVAVVRNGGDKRLAEVKVAPLEPGETPAELTLSRRWLEVLLDENNDQVHQRFIEASLQARRLEYALERYRGLKKRSPDDERIDAYLAQIGKILSFYAFSKEPKAEVAKTGVPRPVKLLALLLLALAAAWFLIGTLPQR